MKRLLGILLILFNTTFVYSEQSDFVTWQKRAEQGNADAQFVLGVMYNLGEGVLQDYKQAVYWWKKSAEQGNALAQHNLGLQYATGQGVTKNNLKAHMWFNISAYSGNTRASEARDEFSKYMTSPQITEAQRMAKKWVENFKKRKKR